MSQFDYIILKDAPPHLRHAVTEVMYQLGINVPSYYTFGKKFGVLLRVMSNRTDFIETHLKAIDAKFEILKASKQ